VVINYVSNAGDARKLAGEMNPLAGRRFAIQANVRARNPKSSRCCLTKTIARLEKLDILVNNAGLMVTKPVSRDDRGGVRPPFSPSRQGHVFRLPAGGTRLADGGASINVSSSRRRG